MIKIDDSLLEEIGLIALPKVERDQLLRQIYETLEMRVGMRLAERMSDQQLDEFEKFIDTNDEAGALRWLETNFPDYKQVVASELDKLKGEIKQDSGKILAAMQVQSVQTPVASPAATSNAQPSPFAQSTPVTQSPVVSSQGSDQTNSVTDSVQQPVAFGQPVQPASDDSQQLQQASPAQKDDDTTTVPPQQSGSIPPPPSF